MHAPRREEPSCGVTAQIAVHKTTRNPTIITTSAVSEDVVMQLVGIDPQGAQPIAPKPLAELALAHSLGPSAGSAPACVVAGIMRSLVVPQASLPMLPGPIATAFRRLQGALPTSLDTSGCFLWL